jgi:hypothetical protein
MPPAPAALARIGAETIALAAGTPVFRVYFAAGPHPDAWNSFRHYGPLRGRFDHHLPPPHLQERGVVYLARHPRTCLAEAFQTTRRIDVFTGQPTLVGFRVVRNLLLLDLTGLWPTRAGASMAISSGPRPRAQRWAQAVYEAFPDMDGVLYGSSMAGNAPCLALFERAADALPRNPDLHRPLSDPTLEPLLLRAAGALGYEM